MLISHSPLCFTAVPLPESSRLMSLMAIPSFASMAVSRLFVPSLMWEVYSRRVCRFGCVTSCRNAISISGSSGIHLAS